MLACSFHAMPRANVHSITDYTDECDLHGSRFAAIDLIREHP